MARGGLVLRGPEALSVIELPSFRNRALWTELPQSSLNTTSSFGSRDWRIGEGNHTGLGSRPSLCDGRGSVGSDLSHVGREDK